jgi:uncharacterized membrane protein
MLDQFLDQLFHFFEPGHSSFEIMPGVQGLGYNVHPLIVHFPIAFLLAYFLLELIGTLRGRQSLNSVASWMLYLGASTAVLAAGAGLYAAARVPHGEDVHEIMEWHRRLGLTVAGLATVLAIWRITVRARFESIMARSLHLGLAAVMVACLIIGTDLGGLMVYGHGVGVKQLQHADDHHHEHAEDHSDPKHD